MSASDGTGSGLVSMQISNNGSSWTDYAYATSQTWTLIAGDGSKTVSVRFKDNAGNWSSTATDSITLDTALPTSCSVSINGGAQYVKSTAVTLTLAATATGSGLASMKISNDDSTWSVYAYDTSKAWSLNGVTEGSKTVYARFSNNAGNWTTTSVTNVITLDTIAPSGTIIINGGDSYTSVPVVNLTLTADDGTGSGLANMQFSNTGSAGDWSSAESLSSNKSWPLSSGDGEQTVYVRYTDNAGNSMDITDTITYDSTGPEGSLIINGGASHTRSAVVTLDISATDALSGMNQMQYSEGGTVWSGLEAYAAGSKVITLNSQNENKLINVRYFDNVGNTSTCVQTIKLVTVNRLVVQAESEAIVGTTINISIAAYTDSTPVTGYLDKIKFVSTDTASSAINDYQFTETDSGKVTINVSLGTIGRQGFRVIDKDFGDITGEVTVKVYQAASVDGTSGTIITNADGTRVEIPGGAFSGSKNVGFTITENPPSAGTSYKYRDTVKPISRDFGELDTSTNPWTFKPMIFECAVPVSIPYTSAEIGDINENNLRMFYYNETTGKYILVEGKQEVKGGKVTAQVNHFSTYRVLGTYVSSNLNNVIAYPNPYSPNGGADGKLKLINLPIDCTATIYNIAGEKIREIKESDEGNLGWMDWDGKNESNEPVGRGVYLYVVIAPDGSKKIGKVGLIKP